MIIHVNYFEKKKKLDYLYRYFELSDSMKNNDNSKIQL